MPPLHPSDRSLIFPQAPRVYNAAAPRGAPLLVALALHPDPVRPRQGSGADGVGAVAGPDGVDGAGGVVPRGSVHVVEGELARGSVDELAHVDPQQPDPGRGIHPSEEVGGGSDHVGTSCHSAGERDRTGDGAEVVEPDLDGHRSSRHPGSPHPGGHRVTETDQLSLQAGEGVVVAGEGLLVADRLGGMQGHHVAVIHAHRQPVEVGTRCRTQRRQSVALRELGQVGHGLDAQPVHLLEGLRAHPPQGLHRQRMEEGEDLPGGHHLHAQPRLGPPLPHPRFGRLRGQLGHELRGGHAHGAGEALLGEDVGADLRPDLGAVAVEAHGPRDVEEGLVEGDGLHQWRVGGEDLHDPSAHRPVVVVVARHEDGVRAEPLRLGGGHG